MTRKTSYIYYENSWHKVKPIIISVTNMGTIPYNALCTSDGTPFLTDTKEYLLMADSDGLTAESTNDYLLYENFKYTAYIK